MFTVGYFFYFLSRQINNLDIGTPNQYFQTILECFDAQKVCKKLCNVEFESLFLFWKGIYGFLSLQTIPTPISLLYKIKYNAWVELRVNLARSLREFNTGLLIKTLGYSTNHDERRVLTWVNNILRVAKRPTSSSFSSAKLLNLHLRIPQCPETVKRVHTVSNRKFHQG